jgi:hypothetical protein
MKLKNLLVTTKTVCLLGGMSALTLATPANGQTLFNNPGGAVNTAGNWDNGLPTTSSQGTINSNATYVGGSGGPSAGQFVGWDVIQTGGTLSRITGNAALVISTNSTFEVNGASAQFT